MNEDSNFNAFNSEIEEPIKRPTFLTVLCVLTFIGSGFSALLNLFCFLFYDLIINTLSDSNNYFIDSVYSNRWMYSIDFFLTTTSIFGAILMYKLKRKGFLLYLLSNLALLCTPLLFISISNFDVLMLMFVTAPFILLYGLHLKHMR